ncbi:MAG TPA: hypothetical protein PK417_03155 [Hyphomonas sp.]|nr:hypothetical protein [Hyphomonas sp.]
MTYLQVPIFLLDLSGQHSGVTESLTAWFVAALEVAEAKGV